jgi:hypothetical protein
MSLLPLLLMGLLQGLGHNFLTLLGGQLILVNIHPSYAVYKEGAILHLLLKTA